MKSKLARFILAAGLIFQLQNSQAQEFEKLGSALSNALGSKSVFKSKVNVGGKSEDVYYTKDAAGKPTKVAVIEKAIYQPNCTHTWVIGLDAKSSKVNAIRVIEFSCPHANPTKAASYMSQYMGKGPADVSTLKDNVQTIAKATGTCNLTTDAVKSAITAASAFAKGNS